MSDSKSELLEYTIKRHEEDISTLKQETRELRYDQRAMEQRLVTAENNIQHISETMSEIKDDVKWVKRAIIGFFVSILGSVLAGVLIWLITQKGG